MKHTLRSI